MGSAQIFVRMRTILRLIYCFCLQFVFCQRDDFVTEIEPDYGPDWGDWNGGVYCPEKQFAHGFKQKTDSWCSGGGECTGLNAIEFLCGLISGGSLPDYCQGIRGTI